MGGRGSGAAGATISSDDDNSTKLLLFISPLPQIVLDERNPSGGLFDYAQSDIIVLTALDRNPFGGIGTRVCTISKSHPFQNRLLSTVPRNDMLINNNKVFTTGPSSVGFAATFSPRAKAFTALPPKQTV